MRTIKLLKITVLALFIGGFVQTAFGQVRPKQQHRMAQRLEKMRANQPFHMRIPNLTDQQKEQLKSITLKNQEVIIPLRNQMREKKAHLRTLSTADNVDQKVAESVIDEIGSLRTQMMKQRLGTHQQVRALLTDEQRVWLDSHPMRRSMHKRMPGMGFDR